MGFSSSPRLGVSIRRFTLVAVALASTQIRCDGGQPPARLGVSLLEFGNLEGSPFGGAGNSQQILLQYSLAQPFDMWGLQGKYLVNDANTASQGVPGYNVQAPANTTTPFDLTQRQLPLSDTPPNDFVQYRSTHAYWKKQPPFGRGSGHFQEYTQHETLLFARNPEEVFETMFDLAPVPNSGPTISDQVRGDFTADTWPDSATLFYPPAPNWNTTFQAPGPTAIHSYYSEFDFWQSGTTPSGPGTFPEPNRRGSVKTAMVVDHGLCSQLVPYIDTPNKSGILSGLATQLFTQAVKGIADKGKLQGQDSTHFSVSLENSDAVSYLDINDDREAEPNGGFFFGFNLFALDNALYAQYWNAYQFSLLDGRLTVDPLRDYASVYFPQPFVGDAGGLVQVVIDALLLNGLASPLRPTDSPQTVSGTVWHKSDQLQAFPGAPGFTCTPDPIYGEKIRVVADPTVAGSNSCSLFFSNRKNELTAALTTGHYGSYIGVPQTAFGQMWNDTVLASSDGFLYDNVRCAPLTDGGTNQCQMILPAQRINVLPDGVELVFVDDDKEYTNPSFIAWLLLADAADPTLLSKLCDPPTQATHVTDDYYLPGRRSFAHATTDNKTFTATNCVEVNPPTVPPTFDCQVLVQ